MILFCLPYAGGSESIYFNWSKKLSYPIDLCAIPLRGRGQRFQEPLYSNIEEATDDIFSFIEPYIRHEKYAIFGHSMGSILAYELYLKIQKNNCPNPEHLFFSAHEAPNVKSKKKNIHELSDTEFLNEIIKMGGTPKEILNNKELINLFLPILRSDIKLLHNYQYQENSSKITCPVSILNGVKDSITKEHLLKWKELTCGQFNIYHFPGNHFFINNCTDEVIEFINQQLLNPSFA